MKKPKVTVEKIGGTSMSAFGDILQNVIFHPQHLIQRGVPYGRIFVVSAYSGITNMLLEHKKTKEPGIYGRFVRKMGFHSSMDRLLKHLQGLNRKLEKSGLPVKDADQFIEERIHKITQLLEDLRSVMNSGYVIEENILLATREILASIGEVHSAFNTALILKHRGYESRYLDLSGFDDNRALTVDERILQSLRVENFSRQVTFITGYVKGVEGIMRKFDRGYTDITFSRVAVLLKSLGYNIRETVIYKEYHLSSADPLIVGKENTKAVGKTNYDVADQLADVGMEAIHPHASKPLEKSEINLRVKNTFEPEHAGTLISKDYQGIKAKVEIITGSREMVLIEVHDPNMVGTFGFDLEISEIFSRHKISYVMKTTNANSISQVIWEKHFTPALRRSLDKMKYQKITVEKTAIVCVIGTNIAVPGVLQKAATALGESKVSVKCISQSLRQVNMQFVIDRKNYVKAIIAINQAFFGK